VRFVQVVVPGELPAGVLYLEVQRGSYMGPALPVLVAASAALAAEAVCMLQMTQPADRQGLIVDLGCAMLQAAVPQQQSRYPSCRLCIYGKESGIVCINPHV